MDAQAKTDANATNVERQSDRELVVTHTFNAPADIVFKAWTTPELFQQWWIPKSFGITVIACEMDIRTGGSYRLTLRHPASGQPMEFFGRYTEVIPASRMVWTNEENGEAGAVTTVAFEERDGRTHVVLTDLYPSKAALDEAIATQATGGFPEQFDQLEKLLTA
jgi:uncharacterized protein YndB with AHSA1/START domain